MASMKKTALIIMALTIISKVFGLGRDVILSYFYGTTYISDAYLISMTIPGVIFGFIAAGLIAGYIPMYTKIAQNEGQTEADNFTSNSINISMVICTVIILIAWPLTGQLVKVFASGFEAETLALTIRLTRISMFAIYFTGMISIFSGYLNIKNNFIIPALVGLPLNLVVVVSIYLSYKTNTVVLAIGFVLAAASQLVLLIPSMKRNHYRYKPIVNFKDKHIINMGIIALPVILGVSVDEINILVDRTIASQIAVGGVSAINYASRLNGFVQAIFVVSITTVLFPLISKMAAEKNIGGLKRYLTQSITGVSLLVIPVTLGAMMFSVQLVSLLFGRGAFDSQSIAVTARALFFFSIGMTFFGLRDVLTKAFYSLQDTKTPVINATIGMVLNIILNIVLSRFMGISGLPLATSISGIVTTLMLFISLRKKIGPFGMRETMISLLKIIVASAVMGILAKLGFDFCVKSMSQYLALLAAVVIGSGTYFVMVFFMKIKDVDVLVKAIKTRFGRGDLQA